MRDYVIVTEGAGLVTLLRDRAALTAPAFPRPADPTAHHASQVRAWLLKPDGADYHDVQGHAA